MEWDFTSTQLIEGQVEYDLEDFLRDLREEVDFNFGDVDEKKKEAMARICYCVCYFSAIGNSAEVISKRTGIPQKLVTMTKDVMEENIDMLEVIFMRKFLINLENSEGLLDNTANLELLNAQVRAFHGIHKL